MISFDELIGLIENGWLELDIEPGNIDDTLIYLEDDLTPEELQYKVEQEKCMKCSVRGWDCDPCNIADFINADFN